MWATPTSVEQLRALYALLARIICRSRIGARVRHGAAADYAGEVPAPAPSASTDLLINEGGAVTREQERKA